VRIISLDRNELLNRLEQIARRIVAERPDVVDVRLFGSLARGDQVGASDADVLVVVRTDAPVDPIAAAQALYPYFDLPVGVDLWVVGERELARRLRAEDVFATRAWGESRDLLPREPGFSPAADGSA
jgi:predicted nucleotidyltransferase